MLPTNTLILELGGAVLLLFFGGFGFGWFRILKETNRLLREQNN